MFNSKITPNTYYYLSNKQRKEIIKELGRDCMSIDMTGLMVTYKEKFNDYNTARCWRDFFQQCLYNKEHNLSVKIPVICPSY